MAKIKSMSEVEKLKAEAKKIAKEAKEKERVILNKIKEKENEIFSKIGKSAVSYINGEIDKEELEKVVKATGLFEKVEEEKEEEEEKSSSFSHQNLGSTNV